MMMVCASEESMDEQKQFMTDLVRLAQETGLHIHLIAHCRKPGSDGESKPPTKYDLRGSAAISDQAHNVITVWSNKPKKAKLDQNPQDIDALAEPDAAVTVEKQRNGRWEGRAKLWFHEPSMRFLDDRMSPVQPYRLEAA
jgi:twinkle protein